MTDNMLIDLDTVERDLHALRVADAPPTLRPAVLSRVGLADSYFPVETPIGPAFVAYNTHGISAVMLAGDAATFEQVYGERFGRLAHPAIERQSSLQHAVTEHLQGKRHDLRFDLRSLSEFEQSVLRK